MVFDITGDCNKVGNKYCTNCLIQPNVCLVHARQSKQDRNLTLVNMFTLAAMHQTQQPLLHVDKAFPCWVTLHFQMYQIPNTISINYQWKANTNTSHCTLLPSLQAFVTHSLILNSSNFTALHRMPTWTGLYRSSSRQNNKKY